MNQSILLHEFDLIDDRKIVVNLKEIQCFYKRDGSEFVEVHLRNHEIVVKNTYEEIKELLATFKF